MSPEAKERVARSLDGGCYCEGLDAQLVRRNNKRGVVTVTLQCLTCGRSVGGPFARKEHFFWQSYPEWDEDLLANRLAAEAAERAERWAEIQNSIVGVAEAKKARAEEWTRRRAEYAAFCRESPEWHELRDAVIGRADGICEGCLSETAITAHHLTYDYGFLPPAWLLKAICRNCHRRLHADKYGENDEWSPLFLRDAKDLT